MAWARIDDGFHSHPKIERLSYAARGVFVTALSYAAHYETDGLLDHEFVKRLERTRGGRSAVKELVVAGMFEPALGGAVGIHDYLECNPSRQELAANRGRDREKKRRQRSTPRLWTGESQSVSPGESLAQGESGKGRGSKEALEEEDDLTGARATNAEVREWVARHFPELLEEPYPTKFEMTVFEVDARTRNIGSNGVKEPCTVEAIREWMAQQVGWEAA